MERAVFLPMKCKPSRCVAFLFLDADFFDMCVGVWERPYRYILLTLFLSLLTSRIHQTITLIWTLLSMFPANDTGFLSDQRF